MFRGPMRAMIEYLFTFLISLALVAVKAFQQLNVVFKKYKWIMPTSLLFAVLEATVWIRIVGYGFSWHILALAIGGAVGCMLSMSLHERFTGKGWGKK